MYLPREDLVRFGCVAVDHRLDGPVELVVAFEAQRALDRLRRGLALVPLLDRRSGACVLAMTGAYRRLLERIASEPETVLRGRLSLRRWEKGLVLARSLLGGPTLVPLSRAFTLRSQRRSLLPQVSDARTGLGKTWLRRA
jgi:phytoene synthase